MTHTIRGGERSAGSRFIATSRPSGSFSDDGAGERSTGIRLLLSAPILLGLLFFFGISVAGHGIQSFSVSALHILHDAPVAAATTVLTAWLFASPIGVLAGGWVADRIERRHEAFAAAEAAVTAARLHFRSVMMTALSFILGVLPLVFASGAGAADPA